ncbi:MAG: FkbM family methyltransferase [Planctomycetes bacterium]|nr:FkbM family methyltransferase [Planctomycetota bacterium]
MRYCGLFCVEAKGPLSNSSTFFILVSGCGWVEKNSISRIDLLKLDTEATEHIVLAGAHNVLAEHRPLIFCEVLPGRIEDELNSIFSEFGYLRFRIGRGGLEEVSQLRHDQSDSNDHLMVHSTDRQRLERFL